MNYHFGGFVSTQGNGDALSISLHSSKVHDEVKVL